MFKTIPEALDFTRELKAGLPDPLRAEVVIAPPFTALQAVGLEIKGSPVQLSGQDVHWAEEGAFTGEISPLMLRDVGCDYCLIGHSERRHWFRETDSQVAQKLQACLKAGLKPVLCLGETLEEREGGRIRARHHPSTPERGPGTFSGRTGPRGDCLRTGLGYRDRKISHSRNGSGSPCLH